MFVKYVKYVFHDFVMDCEQLVSREYFFVFYHRFLEWPVGVEPTTTFFLRVRPLTPDGNIRDSNPPSQEKSLTS